MYDDNWTTLLEEINDIYYMIEKGKEYWLVKNGKKPIGRIICNDSTGSWKYCPDSEIKNMPTQKSVSPNDNFKILLYQGEEKFNDQTLKCKLNEKNSKEYFLKAITGSIESLNSNSSAENKFIAEEKNSKIKESPDEKAAQPPYFPVSTSAGVSKDSSTKSEIISLQQLQSYLKFIRNTKERFQILSGSFLGLNQDINKDGLNEVLNQMNDLVEKMKIYCNRNISFKKIESEYLVPFINLELEYNALINKGEKKESFVAQGNVDYTGKILELYDQATNVLNKLKNESAKSDQKTSSYKFKSKDELGNDVLTKFDDLVKKYDEFAEKFYMEKLNITILKESEGSVFEFWGKFLKLKDLIYNDSDDGIPSDLQSFEKNAFPEQKKDDETYYRKVESYVISNKKDVEYWLKVIGKEFENLCHTFTEISENKKLNLKEINEKLLKLQKKYNNLFENHKNLKSLKSTNIEKCYYILKDKKSQDNMDIYVQNFMNAEVQAISFEKAKNLQSLLECIEKYKNALDKFIREFDTEYANALIKIVEKGMRSIVLSCSKKKYSADPENLKKDFEYVWNAIDINVRRLYDAQTALYDGNDLLNSEKNDLLNLKNKFQELNEELTKICENFKVKNKEEVGNAYKKICEYEETDFSNFLSLEKEYILAVVALSGDTTKIENRFPPDSVDNKNIQKYVNEMYELAVRAVRHLKNKLVKKEKGLLGRVKRLFSFKKKNKDKMTKEQTKEQKKDAKNAQKIEKCFEKVGAYFFKSKKFTRRDVKNKLKDVKDICPFWYENLENYLNDGNINNMIQSFDRGNASKKFSGDDKRRVSIGILLASLYELGNTEYIISACDGLKRGGLRGNFEDRMYLNNAVIVRKGIKNAAAVGKGDLNKVKSYMNSPACITELEVLVHIKKAKNIIDVFK